MPPPWKCSTPPSSASSQGEIDGVEALGQLPVEELTVRENQRAGTALTLARMTTIKLLAGFDFAFQPSLDRQRILALAELTFIDRAEVVQVHFSTISRSRRAAATCSSSL
jgi:hypothetical protein